MNLGFPVIPSLLGGSVVLGGVEAGGATSGLLEGSGLSNDRGAGTFGLDLNVGCCFFHCCGVDTLGLLASVAGDGGAALGFPCFCFPAIFFTVIGEGLTLRTGEDETVSDPSPPLATDE